MIHTPFHSILLVQTQTSKIKSPPPAPNTQIFLNLKIKRKFMLLDIDCLGITYINNDEIANVIYYSWYKKLLFYWGIRQWFIHPTNFFEGLLYVKHCSKCWGQSSEKSQHITSLHFFHCRRNEPPPNKYIMNYIVSAMGKRTKRQGKENEIM